MGTKDDIKLPPLHYDELPEPDDPIPAMHNYARRAIKADRQRRGEQVAPTSDDNTLTIAYMCGYNDSKRSTSPEGWKPVPVEPIYDMTQAGVNLALSSPQTWRRKMTNETILTPTQVDSLLDGVLRSSGSRLGNYTLQKTLDELRSAVRAIEQAVLQSPDVQALKRDKERLDWLADPNNNIGKVQLPRVCVERNLHSLRDAIDEAMENN